MMDADDLTLYDDIDALLCQAPGPGIGSAFIDSSNDATALDNEWAQMEHVPGVPFTSDYLSLPMPTNSPWHAVDLEALADGVDVSSMSMLRKGQIKERNMHVKHTVCCPPGESSHCTNLSSAGPGRNGYECQSCWKRWSQIHPGILADGQDPQIRNSNNTMNTDQGPRSGGYKCSTCRLHKKPKPNRPTCACKDTGGALDIPPRKLADCPSFVPLQPCSSDSSVASSVRTTVVATRPMIVARMVGGGPTPQEEQKRVIEKATEINAKAARYLQAISTANEAPKEAAGTEVIDAGHRLDSHARVNPTRMQLSASRRGKFIDPQAYRSTGGGKPVGQPLFRMSGVSPFTTEECNAEEAIRFTSVFLADDSPATTAPAPNAKAMLSDNEDDGSPFHAPAAISPSESESTEPAVAPSAPPASANAILSDDKHEEPPSQAPPATSSSESAKSHPSAIKKRKACDECEADCSFAVKCVHKKCHRGACSARCAGFRSARKMNACRGKYTCKEHTLDDIVAYCANCQIVIDDRMGETWASVACEDCDEHVAWWCYDCAKVTQKIMNKTPEWRCPAHRK